MDAVVGVVIAVIALVADAVAGVAIAVIALVAMRIVAVVVWIFIGMCLKYHVEKQLNVKFLN